MVTFSSATFFHIHCGKMTFMFIKNQELGHCTNFEPILLSNGSKAFYDPIEHNITSLSTTVPCHGKHHQFSEIFWQDIMQQLTGKIVSLAALKKIRPSISLSNIFNKEAVRSLIHEEELQLEDGNADMASWNEFWRKWSPHLSMFSLGVSVTFLVGVFIAARYSKLNMLRTLALMNGFAKTVYDYLKCRKEQKAEAQNPWFVWSQSPAMWLIRPGHYLSNTNWKLYWILYSLNLTIICHALTMLCMLSMIFCHLSDAMLCVMLFQYPACCKWYFL